MSNKDNGFIYEEMVYVWGVREGIAMRHGKDFTLYPVPKESWDAEDDHNCRRNYLLGVSNGIAIRLLARGDIE